MLISQGKSILLCYFHWAPNITGKFSSGLPARFPHTLIIISSFLYESHDNRRVSLVVLSDPVYAVNIRCTLPSNLVKPLSPSLSNLVKWWLYINTALLSWKWSALLHPDTQPHTGAPQLPGYLCQHNLVSITQDPVTQPTRKTSYTTPQAGSKPLHKGPCNMKKPFFLESCSTSTNCCSSRRTAGPRNLKNIHTFWSW